MERYYFHILDGDLRIEDEEGSDLPNLNAAIEEARISANELVAERLKAGRQIDMQAIEIADADGKILYAFSAKSLIN